MLNKSAIVSILPVPIYLHAKWLDSRVSIPLDYFTTTPPLLFPSPLLPLPPLLPFLLSPPPPPPPPPSSLSPLLFP